MENENRNEEHHSSHHHHRHHHSHRDGNDERRYSSKNPDGQRRHSQKESDSQKKVVNDRMKEVRWEKVFKPIIQVVMIVGFISLIVAIIWLLMNPEMGTRKADPSVQDKIIQNQEELKTELEENDLRKELEDALDRIKDLEKRVAELESEIR